ncbi:MAG TPA: hypothetical protein VGH62_06075 [Bradyrhizobium sp.]|jgi:hypothetical protein
MMGAQVGVRGINVGSNAVPDLLVGPAATIRIKKYPRNQLISKVCFGCLPTKNTNNFGLAPI